MVVIIAIDERLFKQFVQEQSESNDLHRTKIRFDSVGKITKESKELGYRLLRLKLRYRKQLIKVKHKDDEPVIRLNIRQHRRGLLE